MPESHGGGGMTTWSTSQVRRGIKATFPSEEGHEGNNKDNTHL